MRFRRGGSEGPEFAERLDALEEALELADGRLHPEPTLLADQVVTKARERLGHGPEFTLVALLGATGSGKSSVANALAGSEVATTGVRRPTTSSSLALTWGAVDSSALLDWLEVPNRHSVTDVDDGLAGLVLLDVPDHDSVEVTHRLEMERIAEHADLLLWVTDHEKYADLAMHAYLRKLTEHGAVTTMVLNKIDTLDATQVDACRTDLARLLTEDGLPDATVVAVSARTGAGVDRLREVLVGAVSSKRAVVERLSADLAVVADELAAQLADTDHGGRVPDRVRRDLARDLVGASGLEAVTDAVAAGHRRDAATTMGWPFTAWVRNLRPHPLRRLHLGSGSAGRASLPEPSGMARTRAAAAVRNAAESVSGDLPEPWPAAVREAGQPDPAELADELDRAVADAARAHTDSRPFWWRLVRGVQWLLALAAVVGLVWLGLLAFGAYLRLPDVPTPEWEGIPVPTGLLIGGVLAGWLLALLSVQLAGVGARRRAAAVRKDAANRVDHTASRLVIEPIEAELARHDRLRTLLATARGGAT